MQRRLPEASAGFSRFDASIAPPRRRAGADHGVDLVDEQDGARLVLQLGHHRLQPLLEVAAVARAGQQRAHVERVDGGLAPAPPARRPRRCAWPGPRRSRSCRRRDRRHRAGCSWCGGTGSGWCARSRCRGRSAGRSSRPSPSCSGSRSSWSARPGCAGSGFSSRSCSWCASGWLPVPCTGRCADRPGALAMPWLMKFTASSRVMSCSCRK